MRNLVLAGLILVGSSVGAFAQQGGSNPLPEGFETKPLLKTGETRDKDPIKYPDGRPELTSVIGVIQPNGRTPLHEHPIPTFVYVLEGEVELQTEGGSPQRYKAGGAYIESLNKKHQLHNVSGSSPARVLVIFIGEEGKATTVAAK